MEVLFLELGQTAILHRARNRLLTLFEEYCSSEARTTMVNKQWTWYVYIIECLDGYYYTGVTWNIEIRIEQHRTGKGSKFTAKHGFKMLRYYEEFTNLLEARQ